MIMHSLHLAAWFVGAVVIGVVSISLTGSNARKTCYKGYSTWQKKRN
jgi:hypothetical protein